MESDQIFSVDAEQTHLELTCSVIEDFILNFESIVAKSDHAGQRKNFENSLSQYDEVRDRPFFGVIFERDLESGTEEYRRIGKHRIHDGQSNVLVSSKISDDYAKWVRSERSMDENLASASIEIIDGRIVKVTGSASSRALNRRRQIKENKKGVLTDITEVIHPDQFIVAQWDLDQLVAVAAFKRMRARWKKPSATAEHFAEAMERGGLPATAQRLREAIELI